MPRFLGIALLLTIVAGHVFPNVQGEVIVESVELPAPVSEKPEPGSYAESVQRQALENAKQIEKAMHDRADAVAKSIDEQTGVVDDDER